MNFGSIHAPVALKYKFHPQWAILAGLSLNFNLFSYSKFGASNFRLPWHNDMVVFQLSGLVGANYQVSKNVSFHVHFNYLGRIINHEQRY